MKKQITVPINTKKVIEKSILVVIIEHESQPTQYLMAKKIKVTPHKIKLSQCKPFENKEKAEQTISNTNNLWKTYEKTTEIPGTVVLEQGAQITLVEIPPEEQIPTYESQIDELLKELNDAKPENKEAIKDALRLLKRTQTVKTI